MPVLDTQNLNYLSTLGFNFIINSLPKVNFFVQSANIPGLTLGVASEATPFISIPFAGDLEFAPLTISFIVDEEMDSWFEIYSWMIGLGFPEEFSQYKNLYDNKIVTTDAVLTILSNHRNPKWEIQFQDIFPISLSDLEFSTIKTDVDYLIATVTFDYKQYKINKI